MRLRGIFLAGVLLGGGRLAAAQEEGAPVEQKVKRGDDLTNLVKEMKEPLGLTPEQAAKAEAILTRRAQQVAAERAAGKGDRVEMRRRIFEHNRKAREDVEALLTEQQRAKLEEIRHRRRRASSPPQQPVQEPQQPPQ